ncbi:riboflavin synthase [Kordiimonas marina]|uniref:riboflavin synthase n=1 Tax=Kordiimonas marina TaxID=2872312 RepID=UPI001FF45BE0|nr:riboflavin synthase [Kordiimonas marina]MCJ9430398.1 riboflavin synthase [Kordiimonas marina]
MFTGIVTDVGRVRAVEGDADKRVTIETAYDMGRVEIGASIACEGVCLTVVDKGDGWFAADVSAETLKVTNLGDWKVGSLVNLERSLKLGDEMGGHIVTGHVDCVGTIARFETLGESIVMDVAVPASLGTFVAQKGSVAVNGASLTVNSVADEGDITRFSINLIPHTQAVTSFRASKEGDRVNVEFDILARYVARLQIKG